MGEELLKVVKENPDLEIYAWVNPEIVDGEGCYWAGKFSRAEVREYAKLNFAYGWYDTDWVFKDEPEDLIEYLVNTDDYLELSDDEAEAKAQAFIDDLEYKKAIFVFVETL